ncbi:MAG: prolyl oligopeptidase family serine peptidase [Prolixibacteraceae bacterium]|nr:prolyl oligopeptidase family serine peptidase [Prolixibacteraceae bacterium]
MKKVYFLLFAALTTGACSQSERIGYPETKKVQTIDTYFGTEVQDPYRWLEDDTSTETADWVARQNEVTFAYLNRLPARDEIKNRLTALMNYQKIETPFKKAGKYFYYKNKELQNQSVLFMTDKLGGEEKVVLDPNLLSSDGTVALSGIEISPDGKYLVYSISRSGSDWNEIYVKNIETGESLPDVVKWVKFSVTSWSGDGFYYSAYPKPADGSELSASNENHMIRFHKLGSDPEKDPVIYSEPGFPKRLFRLYLTEDRQFLILSRSNSSSRNALSFCRADDSRQFVPLTENFDHDFSVIGNAGNDLYVHTNYKAPKYRLIKIDARNHKEENWQEVIPEKEDVLSSANLIGGKIVTSYTKNACSHIEVYDYNGKFDHKIDLPGIGTTRTFSGEKDNPEAFYSFTSYNTPGEIYRYDFNTRESTIFHRPEVKFNPDDFQVDQVWYNSKDGTRVPMFLFYKKGVAQDGSNPTLLYGYGGFNNSQTPSFSTQRLLFVEQGGILAVANIRGGGEFGETWHKAGTKMQKQNVFNDFIAAAEYLILEKYTSPQKLAIQGGSNGGLLVGAVANQRPELFKVALPAVGVMDMLRYHKFTIGWAWANDYGTSEDNKEMFEYLLGYSPLHNIEAKSYPATLVTTADHDDRVVPAHSFKYISRLQELNAGKLPVLIRIETKAGHGAGKPTAKIIEEYTDIWAFTMYHLGMTGEIDN